MVDVIESALDDLRPGLDADGFELRFEGVEEDGRVRVALEARPGACLDCLVSDELLVQMLEMSIRERMPESGTVVLEKHGF